MRTASETQARAPAVSYGNQQQLLSARFTTRTIKTTPTNVLPFQPSNLFTSQQQSNMHQHQQKGERSAFSNSHSSSPLRSTPTPERNQHSESNMNRSRKRWPPPSTTTSTLRKPRPRKPRPDVDYHSPEQLMLADIREVRQQLEIKNSPSRHTAIKICTVILDFCENLGNKRERRSGTNDRACDRCLPYQIKGFDMRGCTHCQLIAVADMTESAARGVFVWRHWQSLGRTHDQMDQCAIGTFSIPLEELEGFLRMSYEKQKSFAGTFKGWSDDSLKAYSQLSAGERTHFRTYSVEIGAQYLQMPQQERDEFRTFNVEVQAAFITMSSQIQKFFISSSNEIRRLLSSLSQEGQSNYVHLSSRDQSLFGHFTTAFQGTFFELPESVREYSLSLAFAQDAFGRDVGLKEFMEMSKVQQEEFFSSSADDRQVLLHMSQTNRDTFFALDQAVRRCLLSMSPNVRNKFFDAGITDDAVILQYLQCQNEIHRELFYFEIRAKYGLVRLADVGPPRFSQFANFHRLYEQCLALKAVTVDQIRVFLDLLPKYPEYLIKKSWFNEDEFTFLISASEVEVEMYMRRDYLYRIGEFQEPRCLEELKAIVAKFVEFHNLATEEEKTTLDSVERKYIHAIRDISTVEELRLFMHLGNEGRDLYWKHVSSREKTLLLDSKDVFLILDTIASVPFWELDGSKRAQVFQLIQPYPQIVTMELCELEIFLKLSTPKRVVFNDLQKSYRMIYCDLSLAAREIFWEIAAMRREHYLYFALLAEAGKEAVSQYWKAGDDNNDPHCLGLCCWSATSCILHLSVPTRTVPSSTYQHALSQQDQELSPSHQHHRDATSFYQPHRDRSSTLQHYRDPQSSGEQPQDTSGSHQNHQSVISSSQQHVDISCSPSSQPPETTPYSEAAVSTRRPATVPPRRVHYCWNCWSSGHHSSICPISSRSTAHRERQRLERGIPMTDKWYRILQKCVKVEGRCYICLVRCDWNCAHPERTVFKCVELEYLVIVDDDPETRKHCTVCWQRHPTGDCGVHIDLAQSEYLRWSRMIPSTPEWRDHLRVMGMRCLDYKIQFFNNFGQVCYNGSDGRAALVTIADICQRCRKLGHPTHECGGFGCIPALELYTTTVPSPSLSVAASNEVPWKAAQTLEAVSENSFVDVSSVCWECGGPHQRHNCTSSPFSTWESLERVGWELSREDLEFAARIGEPWSEPETSTSSAPGSTWSTDSDDSQAVAEELRSPAQPSGSKPIPSGVKQAISNRPARCHAQPLSATDALLLKLSNMPFEIKLMIFEYTVESDPREKGMATKLQVIHDLDDGRDTRERAAACERLRLSMQIYGRATANLHYAMARFVYPRVHIVNLRDVRHLSGILNMHVSFDQPFRMDISEFIRVVDIDLTFLFKSWFASLEKNRQGTAYGGRALFEMPPISAEVGKWLPAFMNKCPNMITATIQAPGATMAIDAMTGHCKDLRTLSLVEPNGDVAPITIKHQLWRALQRCPNLEHFRMHHTPMILDQDFENLRPPLPLNPCIEIYVHRNLKNLELLSCPEVNNVNLKIIFKQLPALQALGLYDCKLVTSSGLAAALLALRPGQLHELSWKVWVNFNGIATDIERAPGKLHLCYVLRRHFRNSLRILKMNPYRICSDLIRKQDKWSQIRELKVRTSTFNCCVPITGRTIRSLEDQVVLGNFPMRKDKSKDNNQDRTVQLKIGIPVFVKNGDHGKKKF